MKEQKEKPFPDEILGETPLSGTADDGAPPPVASSRRMRTALKGVGVVCACLAIFAGLALGVKWYLGPTNTLLVSGVKVKGDFAVAGSTIRGRINLVSVQEGDRVEKGQTVAEVGSEELRAESDRATAKRKTVRGELEDAEAALALERGKRDETILQAQAHLKLARDRLEQARAAERQAVPKPPDKRYVTYQAGPSYVHDVVEARRAREYFKAEQEHARQEMSRNEAVLKTAGVDTAQLRMLKEKVDALQAKLREAEAELAAANQKLSAAKVVSPITGLVARIAGRAGEMADPGQSIALILNPDRIWVEAQIDEADFGFIYVGQPVLLKAEAFPKEDFSGRVVNVGVAVSSELAGQPGSPSLQDSAPPGKSIPVKVEVDDPRRLLRPGMTASAKFAKGMRNENAVVRPGGG